MCQLLRFVSVFIDFIYIYNNLSEPAASVWQILYILLLDSSVLVQSQYQSNCLEKLDLFIFTYLKTADDLMFRKDKIIV